MEIPTFLTVEEVLEIHQDQITRYGGSIGVRDIGLLESAINAPSASFGGELLHPDIFEMAAALLFALVKNHAFIDGNKRVGTASALVFLAMNGFLVRGNEPELGDLVIAIATGGADRNAVADYFRQHSYDRTL